MTYIEKAFENGYATLSGEGNKQRITYVVVNHSERFADPEEKVRAEFYAELIYRYGYSPDRIGVEITVPDRSPNDFADLVVFRDDERKRPFAVIECKKEAISDAEFAQAVEQAWGNGNAAKFRDMKLAFSSGLGDPQRMAVACLEDLISIHDQLIPDQALERTLSAPPVLQGSSVAEKQAPGA